MNLEKADMAETMLSKQLHVVSESAPSEPPYTITLDDDPLVAQLIEKGLAIRSLSFSNADTLREQYNHLNPKAVFIDIHLKEGSDGLSLIPEMRRYWPYIPLIVITADKDETLINEALSRGADDFIIKPIKSSELKARLQKRWLDQAEKQSLSVLTIEDVVVDSAHHLLKGPLSMRGLSPTELRLIHKLAQAKGTPVSRSSLKFSCWDQISVTENALDRKVYELRKALKDVGSALEIETLYGEGFVLKWKAQNP